MSAERAVPTVFYDPRPIRRTYVHPDMLEQQYMNTWMDRHPESISEALEFADQVFGATREARRAALNALIIAGSKSANPAVKTPVTQITIRFVTPRGRVWGLCGPPPRITRFRDSNGDFWEGVEELPAAFLPGFFEVSYVFRPADRIGEIPAP